MSELTENIKSEKINLQLKKKVKTINPIKLVKPIEPNDYIMVIDVETNGFPDKIDTYSYYNYMLTEKYDNSRIVQISWGLYNNLGYIVKLEDHIIKPNGFTINNSTYHKITNEIANEKGCDIKVVFKKLLVDLKKTSVIVGHNLMFDENIILSELYRTKFKLTIEEFKKKPKHCTCIGTIDLLKIELGNKKYKMPSLDELYYWCFKEHIENAHNSKYDVINTANCYFYIRSNKWRAIPNNNVKDIAK